MNRSLYYMALFLSTATGAAGQCNYLLKGMVTDSKGKPLAAAVQIRSLSKGTEAEGGRFVLDPLCKGRIVLEISLVGYIKQKKIISIPSEEITIVLMESRKELSEVEVIAHSAQEVSRESMLNSKQLEELSGKTVGESVSAISGVSTIQSGPGIFKPVIQGLFGQRIMVLNQGVRLESQSWGIDHAPELDIFPASSIAVIKDASSIKYGSEVLGGVILINSDSLPTAAGLGGSLTMIGQSNGKAGIFSGMLQGGVKGRPGFGWRINSSAKHTGDYSSPRYSLTNTGVRELNFSGSGGYHSKKGCVEILVNRFQTGLGILRGASTSNYDDLVAAMERPEPQYTGPFSYRIVPPRQEVEHHLAKVSGHLNTPWGVLRGQYSFQMDNRREYDQRMGGLSETPALHLLLNTHLTELEWEKTIHSLSLTGGLTYMNQDNHNVSGTLRIPFIPDYVQHSTGIYSVGKWALGPYQMDAGTRFDFRHYEVEGFDFKNAYFHGALSFHGVSASAGVRRAFTAQSISLHINSAWRPPNVAELYSLGTHQSALAIEYGILLDKTTNEIKPLPKDFKMERSCKAAATYTYQNDYFALELTPYANYIFNYIYARPFGITQNLRGTYPFFRYTQTDAFFAGLDGNASMAVLPFLKFSTGVSWLRASDVTNKDYLVFIPPNRYELALRYDKNRSRHQAYMEVKGVYHERQWRAPRTLTVRELREANPAEKNPLNANTSNFDFMDAPSGYWLFEAAIGYGFIRKSGKYDVRLAAYNLFNTVYRDYTNRLRYYADAVGNNIQLNIIYKF